MTRQKAARIIANFIYELNVEAEECDKRAQDLLEELESAGIQLIGPQENEAQTVS